MYNTFTVLDTVHVKGAMTVGENTAYIGGVAIAYDAFKLNKQGGARRSLAALHQISGSSYQLPIFGG